MFQSTWSLFRTFRAVSAIVSLSLVTAAAGLTAGNSPLDTVRDQSAKVALKMDGSPSKTINYMYQETQYTVMSETRYTYDANDNVLESITLYVSEGTLVNSSRPVYVYDGSGNVLTQTDYTWVTDAWAESSRQTNTYSSGNLTETLSENKIADTWTTSGRVQNTYDAEGNVIIQSYSYYAAGTWYPSTRSTYTYNAAGEPLISIFGTYNGEILSEDSKQEYAYNTDGTLATMTASNRQNSESPWVVHTIMTYSYDAQARVTQEIMAMRHWETNNMEETHRTTFAYDAQGRLSETEMFYREITANPWEPMHKNVYIYGDTAVEAGPAPATFALLANTPNPFNPSTVIPFTLAAPGHVTLTVYSATGQKVTTLIDATLPAGLHQATWDARGFATGTYISRLTVNGQTLAGKMTLVK